METGVSTASGTVTCLGRRSLLDSKPISKSSPYLVLASPRSQPWRWCSTYNIKQSRSIRLVALVKKTEDTETEDTVHASNEIAPKTTDESKTQIIIPKVADRLARKKTERYTYLVAAIMSSLGVTSAAIMAVYYRFSWQMEGGEFPLLEMFGTFLLSVGAAVGMEFWARWAHRALWHASLWHMHKSHHRPRDGPFEHNDVFAIINAMPAVALLSYGFFTRGLLAGLCFGAGLGITLFGMAYMFVHDGLVHRRFPVGPIANVPYLRRVAVAHHLHHTDIFDGVPYGLFLGPKEIEEVGGTEELEMEINKRIKKSKTHPYEDAH